MADESKKSLLLVEEDQHDDCLNHTKKARSKFRANLLLAVIGTACLAAVVVGVFAATGMFKHK